MKLAYSFDKSIQNSTKITSFRILAQGRWRGDGPNGGTVENCMVMLHGAFPGRWSDIACLDSYSFCVPCEFEEFSTMYLKGGLLCNTSPFNTEYLLVKDINEKPSLTGFLHSDIFWENNTQSWVLASRKVTLLRIKVFFNMRIHVILTNLVLMITKIVQNLNFTMKESFLINKILLNCFCTQDVIPYSDKFIRHDKCYL